MPLDRATILAEIDEVFRRCGATAESPFLPLATPYSRAAALERGDTAGEVRGNRSAIATECVGAIARNAPHRSYVQTARELSAGGAATTSTVEQLLGVLASVRQDIEAGYTKTLEERVRETLFDDCLEMAEQIRATMHPAPDLVLAVSVL